MSVRYKFKNTISNYDKIEFNGDSISLEDFKKTVVQQKHLNKVDDDLRVMNAETKKEFINDELIPKNTTLIVSRVPCTPHSKKSVFDKSKLKPKLSENIGKAEEQLTKTILDLSKLNISEEKKIEVMMAQSTAEYNPKTYKKLFSTSEGRIPNNYRCKRCYLQGHWIKDCPVALLSRQKVTDNRRKAGIPRTFQQNDAEKENVAIQSDRGEFCATKTLNVPEDLQCPICKEILVDAVLIACCGSSFCDGCIITALLESTENVCPSCKEKDTSLDSLIPNRYLRKSVQLFIGKSQLKGKPLTDLSDKQENKIECATKVSAD